MKKALLKDFTSDVRKIYLSWIETGRHGDELLIQFLEQGDFYCRNLIMPEMWNRYFSTMKPRKLYRLVEEVASIVGIDEARSFSTLVDPQILQSIIQDLTKWEKTQKRIDFEANHLDILKVLKQLTYNGKMPTKTQIACHTGLSRQTIGKHFAEMRKRAYIDDKKDVQLLGLESVVATLYHLAVNQSDTKAAKLYFDIVTNDERLAAKARQTNYIQVNNTRININQLESLEPEKLAMIESILTGGPLPPMVGATAAADADGTNGEETETPMNNTLKLIASEG